MKVKLKPWQIGLIAAAGAVVLGGAGTGIYFGVNRSIDDKVKEQVDAAMESVYSSEAALDESETPTQAAGETTAENTTAAQPTKEPETVIVYVEPSMEKPITWEYDPKLSYEFSMLIGKKFPDAAYDPTLCRDDLHPENFINPNTKGLNRTLNSAFYAGDILDAQSLFSEWTDCNPFTWGHPGNRYFIQIYKFSNGWMVAYVN